MPFLEGRAAQRERARGLRAADRLEPVGHRSTSTACARSRSACDRRARPAADGHRRLERRHEPGRRRGQGRKRLARLVPGLAAAAVRRPRGRARRSRSRATSTARHADQLTEALDDAWDGDWYRRAYFDDGTPLGSKENAECRIDAIAQSWAVISGAGDPERARAGDGLDRPAPGARAGRHRPAADAAVRQDDARAPATSRATCPGVRENGGQYTHAALWTILALARLGDGDRAEALFRMINPVNHAHRRGERRALPGRALRRRRRRLLAGPPRRARRLDVVHGVGGLDVPGRHRSASSASPCIAARCASIPCIPSGVEGLRDRVPVGHAPSSTSRSRTPTASAAA